MHLRNYVFFFIHRHKWSPKHHCWIFTADIQFSSVTQLYPILREPMDCSALGLPVHHPLPKLLKLMSIKLVMSSNHLILCCPLLLLPSIIPSIRVFSKESLPCIRWPKYWSFSIRPSNEYSELISSRIDWCYLLILKWIFRWKCFNLW